MRIIVYILESHTLLVIYEIGMSDIYERKIQKKGYCLWNVGGTLGRYVEVEIKVGEQKIIFFVLRPAVNSDTWVFPVKIEARPQRFEGITRSTKAGREKKIS